MLVASIVCWCSKLDISVTIIEKSFLAIKYTMNYSYINIQCI